MNQPPSESASVRSLVASNSAGASRSDRPISMRSVPDHLPSMVPSDTQAEQVSDPLDHGESRRQDVASTLTSRATSVSREGLSAPPNSLAHNSLARNSGAHTPTPLLKPTHDKTSGAQSPASQRTTESFDTVIHRGGDTGSSTPRQHTDLAAGLPAETHQHTGIESVDVDLEGLADEPDYTANAGTEDQDNEDAEADDEGSNLTQHPRDADHQISSSYVSEARSFLSEAAGMFAPNRYLDSQAQVEQLNAERQVALQEEGGVLHRRDSLPYRSTAHGAIQSTSTPMPIPSRDTWAGSSSSGNNNSTQNVTIPVLPFRRRAGSRHGTAIDDEEEALIPALDPADDKLSLVEEVQEGARRWYGSLTGTETYEVFDGAAGEERDSALDDGATRATAEAPGSADGRTQAQRVSWTAGLRRAMGAASSLPGGNLGLILIVLCQLCYSVMNLFVKLLGREDSEIGPLEIVGVECLVMWLGCIVTMKLAKTPYIILGPPGVRLLLVIRGIAGFASTLFLYLSLQHLSLSDATTLTFVGPLLIGFLGSCLLAEPFGQKEMLAGVISLGGVVLIARPSFLFGGDGSEMDDGGGEDTSAAARLWGVACVLLSVAFTSAAWVSLRTIGNRASTYHSIAYFALCSWTASVAVMLSSSAFFSSTSAGDGVGDEGVVFAWPQSWVSAMLLTLVGVFSLLAQVFQTLGLQRESAGRAASVTFVQIIFATVWQTALLHAPLEPLSVVGSALIMLCGLWVASSSTESTRGGRKGEALHAVH